jgi:hypothetical protein
MCHLHKIRSNSLTFAGNEVLNCNWERVKQGSSTVQQFNKVCFVRLKKGQALLELG